MVGSRASPSMSEKWQTLHPDGRNGDVQKARLEWKQLISDSDFGISGSCQQLLVRRDQQRNEVHPHPHFQIDTKVTSTPTTPESGEEKGEGHHRKLHSGAGTNTLLCHCCCALHQQLSPSAQTTTSVRQSQPLCRSQLAPGLPGTTHPSPQEATRANTSLRRADETMDFTAH